jgi:hypothetical protein
MAVVTIPRDRSGRMILPGKSEHETVWDFADLTTLPSGITLVTGTAPVTARSGGRGEVKLTTGATIGDTASITLPVINLASCETAAITVEGVKTAPADTPEVFTLAMTGATNVGAFAKKEATAADMYIKYANAGTSNLLNYAPFNAAQVESITVTFLIVCAKKMVYLMEGDQIVGASEFTSMLTNNTVTPTITIGTNTAAVKKAGITKIRLTTRVN